MMVTIASYLFIPLLATGLMARAIGDKEISQLIKNIPKQEKNDFLLYAIKKGYLHETGKRHEYVPALIFSIYNYYKDDMVKAGGAVSDMICIPGVGCFDPNDPGVHPVVLKSTKTATLPREGMVSKKQLLLSKRLGEIICIPNVGCIDPQDPGVHP